MRLNEKNDPRRFLNSSWELMIAQQKQIKSDNIRKSAVEYCVSFVVVILMVYAIKKSERRKLNISR